MLLTDWLYAFKAWAISVIYLFINLSSDNGTKRHLWLWWVLEPHEEHPLTCLEVRQWHTREADKLGDSWFVNLVRIFNCLWNQQLLSLMVVMILVFWCPKLEIPSLGIPIALTGKNSTIARLISQSFPADTRHLIASLWRGRMISSPWVISLQSATSEEFVFIMQVPSLPYQFRAHKECCGQKIPLKGILQKMAYKTINNVAQQTDIRKNKTCW